MVNWPDVQYVQTVWTVCTAHVHVHWTSLIFDWRKWLGTIKIQDKIKKIFRRDQRQGTNNSRAISGGMGCGVCGWLRKTNVLSRHCVANQLVSVWHVAMCRTLPSFVLCNVLNIFPVFLQFAQQLRRVLLFSVSHPSIVHWQKRHQDALTWCAILWKAVCTTIKKEPLTRNKSHACPKHNLNKI